MSATAEACPNCGRYAMPEHHACYATEKLVECACGALVPPREWDSHPGPAGDDLVPVCVHDDGTEHVLERGEDGLYGCDECPMCTEGEQP